METDQRTYLPWDKDKEAYGDAIFDERSKRIFHAPARENYVLQDDLYGKICEKIMFTNWDDKQYRTYYSTDRLNEIYFWGHEKNIILKVDKANCKIKTYKTKYNSPGIFFFPIWSEDVEALGFGSNCIIKYDEKKDLFSNIDLSINFDDFFYELKNKKVRMTDVIKFNYSDILREEISKQLCWFILLLEKTNKEVNYCEENKGNMIYQRIKELNVNSSSKRYLKL